jgi:hypothetical protein
MQRNPLYAYTPKKFTTRTFHAPEKKKTNWKKIIWGSIFALVFVGII